MKTINPYKLFHGAFLPNWLLEKEDVSLGAKVVYAKLCQFADKKTGLAWPKQDTLAKSVCISERQCRRYISELESKKLLKSIQLGLGASNKYVFLEHESMGYMTGQDRTDMTGQERTDMTGPIYRKDSIEKIQDSICADRTSAPQKKENTRGRFLTEEEIKDSLVEWGDWAKNEYGFTDAQVTLELNKFYDYWSSKSGSSARKREWFATWRNWVRNSVNYKN